MPMIPALILILAAVAFRILTGLAIISGSTGLSNFAPLAAIALCGAVYFPAKFKFTIPLVALFLSDVVLNVYYGAPLFVPLIACRYFALALIGWLGLVIANQPSWKTLLPASLVASTFFYGITNVFSWLSDPGYPKNLSGLVQALTVGLPQYSATPTWMFFRNSILSDLFFTGLFLLCMSVSRSSSRARTASVLPHTA
jgi:hypothetical protein